MPNRIIKESICTSEKIDRLGAEAECFFYRLVVNCDDFGLLDARTAILKSKCYPLKSVDSKRIKAMLDALHKVGLVEIYEVDGRPYLHIAKWDKHQQIRAKRAKYPMPTDGHAITCNQVKSDESKCPRNPNQSESNPNLNPNQSSASADVSSVFDHWRVQMNHPAAKLDDKRKKTIRKAFELGYSLVDLITAIDGCAKSAWHMGQNDRGIVYDDICLILRDAEKIDRFIKQNSQQLIQREDGTHETEQQRVARLSKSVSGRIQLAAERDRAGRAAGQGHDHLPVDTDGQTVRTPLVERL